MASGIFLTVRLPSLLVAAEIKKTDKSTHIHSTAINNKKNKTT